MKRLRKIHIQTTCRPLCKFVAEVIGKSQDAREEQAGKENADMKIAICSKDNTLSSEVDSRFGRCRFFALYDSTDQSVTFIRNTAGSLAEGAGPAAFKLLQNQNVEKIISGNFGLKLKALASDASIQLIIPQEKYTLKEIIHLLHH